MRMSSKNYKFNLIGLLKRTQARKVNCKSSIAKAGFTIVEISIVIVIIGLIIGGIMVGQDLIRAAELRSVITQKEATIAAIYTFRNTYNAIPGDMPNATSIWGAAADCTSPQTTTATCNGDGNGNVDETVNPEPFLFWKHLANAGLISGDYTGVKSNSYHLAASELNVPKGKISNSLWFSWKHMTVNGIAGMVDGVYGNVLMIGGKVGNGDPLGSIFRPSEIWDIDRKIDDGKPGTGKVVPRATSGLATCTTTSNGADTTADYLLSTTSLSCMIYFRNQF